jgi:hypothetical protein
VPKKSPYCNAFAIVYIDIGIQRQRVIFATSIMRCKQGCKKKEKKKKEKEKENIQKV